MAAVASFTFGVVAIWGVVAILAITLGRCGGSGILPRSTMPAARLSASSTTVACSAEATVSVGGELGLNAVGDGHAMAGADMAGTDGEVDASGAGAAGCVALAAAILAVLAGATLAGAIPGGAATVAGILLVLPPVLGFAAAKGGGGTVAICAGIGGGGAGAKAGTLAVEATAAAGSLGFLISSKVARASVAVVVLAVWTAT